MSKDLPTSPRPCLPRSWSGCSTSSLLDLIDWPMWVEFNCPLVFTGVRDCMRNEGREGLSLHHQCHYHSASWPQTWIPDPRACWGPMLVIYGSRTGGLSDFPSWETAGWVTIKPKSFLICFPFPAACGRAPSSCSLRVASCRNDFLKFPSQPRPSGMNWSLLKDQWATGPSRHHFVWLKSFVFSWPDTTFLFLLAWPELK